MSRRVQAVFDRSPDVENLCEETREVLRMLGQSFDCTDHYLKRAVVSLLTKAGDDLKALALVWFAGHTSASNAVIRSGSPLSGTSDRWTTGLGAVVGTRSAVSPVRSSNVFASRAAEVLVVGSGSVAASGRDDQRAVVAWQDEVGSRETAR